MERNETTRLPIEQIRQTVDVRTVPSIRAVLDGIRRDRIKELNAKGYNGTLALGQIRLSRVR